MSSGDKGKSIERLNQLSAPTVPHSFSQGMDIGQASSSQTSNDENVTHEISEEDEQLAAAAKEPSKDEKVTHENRPEGEGQAPAAKEPSKHEKVTHEFSKQGEQLAAAAKEPSRDEKMTHKISQEGEGQAAAAKEPSSDEKVTHEISKQAEQLAAAAKEPSSDEKVTHEVNQEGDRNAPHANDPPTTDHPVGRPRRSHNSNETQHSGDTTVGSQPSGVGNSRTNLDGATVAGERPASAQNHRVEFEMQIVLLSTLHIAVHYGLGLPSVPSIIYPSLSAFAPSPYHHSSFSIHDYGVRDYFNTLCNFLSFLALLTTVSVALLLFSSCGRRHPRCCATVEKHMSRAFRASYLMSGFSALIRAFLLYANLLFIIYMAATLFILGAYLFLLRFF